MMPSHRPSGSQCVQCVNRSSDCSGLDFAAMRPAGRPDADGVQRVACTGYRRGDALPTLVQIREKLGPLADAEVLGIVKPPPLTGTPPAMTHSDAVAAFPGWRSPSDPPAVGEMVEVAMFAGRVGNHRHPGYPGKPWIERTTLLCVMRDGRGIFGSEAVKTGNVIAWRPIKPCRCGPGGCGVSDCTGKA